MQYEVLIKTGISFLTDNSCFFVKSKVLGTAKKSTGFSHTDNTNNDDNNNNKNNEQCSTFLSRVAMQRIS